MLDTSFATQERTLSARTTTVPRAYAWHPGRILLPVWQLDRSARLFKRALDLIVAALGLVLLMPLGLCLIAAIRFESPGPALFRQRRIGLNGAPFTLIKFRTMRASAEPSGTLRQATRHDPRVTPIGRWLRRFSLDELPQLINVLKGEMSIVGPRPHAPGTKAGGRLFEDVSLRYAARHCVKPGITGLAQVRGWRGETDTEEKLLHRIECDLEYIATWSAGLDLKIMGRTAISVFRMHNVY